MNCEWKVILERLTEYIGKIKNTELSLSKETVPEYKTQAVGPTWVSCQCVKITLVPRWPT